MIFHSYIQTNLNYVSLIWFNGIRTDMIQIENVQKYTHRIVYNDNISDYVQWATKESKCMYHWDKMDTKQLVTEVYKAMTDLIPSYISDMFKDKTINYNLRSCKIIPQSKFNCPTNGYNSLRNEGTCLWAMLPTSCKEGINTFKWVIADFINCLLILYFYLYSIALNVVLLFILYVSVVAICKLCFIILNPEASCLNVAWCNHPWSLMFEYCTMLLWLTSRNPMYKSLSWLSLHHRRDVWWYTNVAIV